LNPISNTVYETILVSHPTNPLFKTGNFYWQYPISPVARIRNM
jgi:hypothetical protein